ncbi:MAG: sigma-54 dependent transcriptional regulator [Nitrospirota bacterium]|jgi:DNA-binding NtrC family response regulator
MKTKVLVVDDEMNILKVLSAALKRRSFEVETARSGEEAMAKFKGGSFDAVLTDYKLPGISGEELLEKMRVDKPSIPVILLTAYGTIDLAVNAMKKGAYTFLTKPVNTDILISVLGEALRIRGAKPSKGNEECVQFLNIVSRSDVMEEVLSMVRRISKTDANVLILGDSGTGKELIARAIHYSSHKAGGPFIPLDCTAIPQELMESELFGHEKGAFTCAYESKVGLLEMASGGTIFLDEIGDLDFSLQKKLLRFLQEKEFYKLGGKKRITVDARVLAATNQDIEGAVERGEFRSDLFYRLNVITLRIPPLRERKDDIPLLAAHFLDFYSRKNKKDIRGFDETVMDLFMAYDWPGNVRELENTVERAVILCPYDTIGDECIPRKLRLLAEHERDYRDEEFNLLDMEKRFLMKALEKASWNQSQASKLLGISRKQLRTKMKNHGLLPAES